MESAYLIKQNSLTTRSTRTLGHSTLKGIGYAMIPIEVVLKEGPVRIPVLGRSGVDATYDLWNEMSASESFPPDTESAFYFLSIRKPVGDPNQVGEAEAELVSALQLLSAAWPFCGGSFMVLESREVITAAKFQSNASTVLDQLLAQRGERWIAASATVVWEAAATYRLPPLKGASTIAKAATKDYGLHRLLRYHQTAWVEYYHGRRGDPSSWFIDLYKVRDFLQKFYGSEQAAKSELSIDKRDWPFFGGILNNNDLRHAEITGLVPSVPRGDIDRLFGLARTWTARHLRKLGLPVLDDLCRDSA